MRGRHPRIVAGGVLLLSLFAASPAVGYIHYPPPTLQKLCMQSRAIRLLTLKKYDKEAGVVVFEATETLKGETPGGATFKHVIGKASQGTRAIYDWLAAGKQAVMFTIETGPTGIACGYVFIDRYCYSVDRNASGEFWLLVRTDPEMAATFFGTAQTLLKVTKDVLAGKDVKAPVDASLKPVSNEERGRRAAALEDVLVKNRQR